MLRSSRTVISQYQDLINDPAQGGQAADAGPRSGGDGRDLQEADGQGSRAPPTRTPGRAASARRDGGHPGRRRGEPGDDQPPRRRLQGLHPGRLRAASSARSSARRSGTEARMKVTAPEDPHPQPAGASRRLGDRRPDGEIRQARMDQGRALQRGRRKRTAALRSACSCRNITAPPACPATALPAGEMDITGYPKEGGKEGDLGAAISIALFR